MRDSWHDRNDVVQQYVDRALRAERNRAQAVTDDKGADAVLWAKMAAYLWAQAEHGVITSEDAQERRVDLHRLDKRFLAVVTGKPEIEHDPKWNQLHRFLLTAALDVLKRQNCTVAFLHFIGGFTVDEIAAETGMKVSHVERHLSTIRQVWDYLLHSSAQLAQGGKVVQSSRAKRNYRGRITALLLERPALGIPEICKVLNEKKSQVENTVKYLESRGMVVKHAYQKPGQSRVRTLWSLTDEAKQNLTDDAGDGEVNEVAN